MKRRAYFMVPHVAIVAAKAMRESGVCEESKTAGDAAIAAMAFSLYDCEYHNHLPDGASWNPPAPGTPEAASVEMVQCPSCDRMGYP